jgi:hypothetical protein
LSPPQAQQQAFAQEAPRTASANVMYTQTAPRHDPAAMPPPPAPAAAAYADAERPSFKRLASQTLGPEHAKRAMTAHEYEPEGAEYAYYARGGSESPPPAADARPIAGLPERYRRMSAPQPPVGLAQMQESLAYA